MVHKRENMNHAWNEFIKTYAKEDSDLVKAIITQESGWNAFAIRYEQTYQYLFNPDEFAKKNKVTLSTEINTQKMSWGLGQIMGAVARELGFEGSMPLLSDAQLNILLMCTHISRLKKISDQTDDIIAMYNGGTGALHKLDGKYKNFGYVDSVKKHLKNLKEVINIES